MGARPDAAAVFVVFVVVVAVVVSRAGS